MKNIMKYQLRMSSLMSLLIVTANLCAVSICLAAR